MWLEVCCCQIRACRRQRWPRRRSDGCTVRAQRSTFGAGGIEGTRRRDGAVCSYGGGSLQQQGIPADVGGGVFAVAGLDGTTGTIGQAGRDASGVRSVVRATGSLGGDLVSPGEGLRQTLQCRRRSASADRQTFIGGYQVSSSLQNLSGGSGVDSECLTAGC